MTVARPEDEAVDGSHLDERSYLDDLADQIRATQKSLRGIRLARRLVFAWLTLGNGLLIGLTVMGNLLIDFSRPGGGRGVLNFFGVAFSLISIVASTATAIMLWIDAQDTADKLADLEQGQNIALAQSLPAGDQSYRRYRSQIGEIVESYRNDALKHRRTHNRLQIVVIVGSIMASIATTAATSISTLRWIAVAVSGVVFYIGGGERLFQVPGTKRQRTASSGRYRTRVRSIVLGNWPI